MRNQAISNLPIERKRRLYGRSNHTGIFSFRRKYYGQEYNPEHYERMRHHSHRNVWQQPSNYNIEPSCFSVDEKVEMLQFAFPNIESGIIEDILVTQNYNLAYTAEILSNIVTETALLQEEFQWISFPEEDEPDFQTYAQVIPTKITNEWVMVPDDYEETDGISFTEEKNGTEKVNMQKDSHSDDSSIFSISKVWKFVDTYLKTQKE